MDLAGKTIMVKGKFHALSQAEIAERLEARGAKVTKSFSGNTDLIFTTRDIRLDGSQTQGVPIFDESALIGLIGTPKRGFEQPEPPEDLDIPALREELYALEAAEGVTDAHREATARVLAAGASLLHAEAHVGELTGLALSPDGRYLALGSASAVPDSGDGDAWGIAFRMGGTLQIWDVAAARPVHNLRHSNAISGGVGWPGEMRSVQWSADSSRIGISFGTNRVGVWEPFANTNSYATATADVTDGMSRPPAFALAPDGRRAYIGVGAAEERELPGCVVPLDKGGLFWNPAYAKNPRYGPAPTRVPARPNDIDDWLDTPRWAAWSGDGRYILAAGFMGPPTIAAIDAETGEAAWTDRLRHLDTGGTVDIPVALSPDGRFLAYLGRDGVSLVEFSGPSVAVSPVVTAPRGTTTLAVTAYGDGARVALLSPDGVLVIDGDAHHHLRIEPLPTNEYMRDATAWSWSPDGTRAACLTDGGVEIWSFGPEPERVGVVAAVPGARGVFWGADGVVVTIAEATVRFTRVETGEIAGEFDFGAPRPSAPRPLLDPGGDDLGDDHRINPTFALDERTWAVAFGREGVVIAPDGRLADLDARLTWSVALRYAWPVRWGPLSVFPDVQAAYEHAVREDLRLRWSLGEVLDVERT